MAEAVVLEGLTRRFGSRTALDGLTLSVPEGAVFGFLGPNGAGKTTTFAILCGFLRPSAGRARVLGEPIEHLHRVRDRIAALPQGAAVWPNRSIRDSLRFLAELSGMESPEARRRADELLEAFGLAQARDVAGRALSHGMAKRFALAQVFLAPADLILLDEPTEGLDPRAASEVRERVRALSRRSTVIWSSHNLAEVEDLCDEAAILDRGRLVTQGTIAALTTRDEKVLITLGPGAPPAVEAVRAIPGVREVERSADGSRVRVTLQSDPDAPPEVRITAILRALMDRGCTIGSVRPGRTLEERFLELT